MAKRSNRIESHDTSSSEDELQIDVYSDMLERVNLDENDSSDSDIGQPPRRRRNRIDSDSDENDTEEDTPISDNVSSSEEWEDVTESSVPPETINFDLHNEIAGPQLPNNATKERGVAGSQRPERSGVQRLYPMDTVLSSRLLDVM
ncbi:hypothetical protein O3M35_011351 [Rhynocoris fuscipes]|uniref:Uncharacterized protein n=1 Tax=Rhynocoris fuscipes TaxID=488301 RepID=A0AAW1CVZ2_9HEMI